MKKTWFVNLAFGLTCVACGSGESRPLLFYTACADGVCITAVGDQATDYTSKGWTCNYIWRREQKVGQSCGWHTTVVAKPLVKAEVETPK